jgi:hypothetical protein
MLMAVIVYDAAQSYGVYFDRGASDLIGQILASKWLFFVDWVDIV